MKEIAIIREKGEQIRINDNVIITILGKRRDEIRIGIDAPLTVHIRRAELLDDKKEIEKINKLLPPFARIKK